MIDPRFYQKQGPFSLNTLGLSDKDLPPIMIHDVAVLAKATPQDITYCAHKKHMEELQATRAAVCLVNPDLAAQVPASTIAVSVAHPRRLFAQIAQRFYPKSIQQSHRSKTAVIHPTAQVAPDCQIGDFVVIGEGAIIGAGTRIESHVVIGPYVQIGKNCHIHSLTHIQYALIGNQVTVKSGAKIGQAGFGFEIDEAGPIDVPQLGCVVIEDNVQIGANTAIDRGTMENTFIGAGSRIDNLVQIAHNVRLGKNCVLVAQVGIAGSSQLGNFVIAAGQVGIADHLTIGDGVRIAAQGGVIRDVAPQETIAGSPAVTVRDWHRQTIALQRLIHGKGKKNDV